jgi:hypothetical protein
VVKLELTIDEVNAVLNALGQLPYVQVVNLIGNIREQAVKQVNFPKVKADDNPYE